MKRAGQSALDRIIPLLEELRAHPALREKRPGVFYLNSREFLHFHDDPVGVFADVRLAEGFFRLPVTSRAQQSDLLARIDQCLSTTDERIVDRQRQHERHRKRYSSNDDY